MRLSAVAIASVVAAAACGALGCSSKQGSPAGGGISGTAQGANPQGVPYPTVGIGIGARGLNASDVPNSNRHGDVIQNYKFEGYPDGDSSKPMQVVQLADYYDPTGAKYKLIHIIAASSWCGPCNDETSALVTALASAQTNYVAQGVVYVQALVEGFTPNVGATTPDLKNWISLHHPTFAEVLDPEAYNLGEFFDAAAVPFNADIDPRSMEVLQAGTGQEAPDAVQVWLDWVKANPATKYE